LVHLSELSDKPVSNPAEVLRLGEKVKAKIILLDAKNRKI
jgi:ribosomal protein S1